MGGKGEEDGVETGCHTHLVICRVHVMCSDYGRNVS